MLFVVFIASDQPKFGDFYSTKIFNFFFLKTRIEPKDALIALFLSLTTPKRHRIGYIITENFAILLNEKYSIEELYLIYSFLESFLDYFRIQTRAYKIKYTFFDHLTSMMNLTLINIENHLRQYIEDLEEDYYNSDNLEFLIQFLSDRFCYVKYLSKTLKQKVWYMILRHVTQLYISNYFKKESFDISPLALAEKISKVFGFIFCFFWRFFLHFCASGQFST